MPPVDSGGEVTDTGPADARVRSYCGGRGRTE
jgi:hypothetical protein